MDKKYGYVRIGAIVPKIKVANTDFNTKEIISEIKKADSLGISIVTTPELSLTGYTCADLFSQDILIEESYNGIERILDETKDLDIVSIIGAPIRAENQLFNCAVVIQKGNILGIIPKTYIPNYSEFYEKRWFASSINAKNKTVNINGNQIPFGTNIIFNDIESKDISFCVEICEDLWCSFPPSTNHTLKGATIVFNLSASNEVIGKYNYRKELVKNQSAKTLSAYVYASSGANESTTDLVFGGQSLIAECGTILEENERFNFESNLTYTDIDVKRIMNNRYKNISYMGVNNDLEYTYIELNVVNKFDNLKRSYEKFPFVPSDEKTKDQRCEEIFNIQATGLAKRLLHTNFKKTVIGISGGLDSTLAFLVILEAYKKIGIDVSNLIAITLPGFGTTNRTYQNACNLVKESGATLKEIDIKEACNVHMRDIELDTNDRSITYENSQARERTQILMDVANKENALVIGTGDLSELALGWCTYNGDHMSMYAVNNSIPKTLVRYLVKWIADKDEKNKKTIYDILDTPVSPELLPPDEQGKIVQKTEDSIGPYMLHDFFLYHFLRYGAAPEKIYMLASETFKDEFNNEQIKKWLIVFLRRFFSQQFKRSCVPDGPKVGTISLSPRGDLRMPSDADVNIWIERLNKLN
jgi:NAD+ synthase (glutamine-hydrolysing)